MEPDQTKLALGYGYAFSWLSAALDTLRNGGPDGEAADELAGAVDAGLLEVVRGSIHSIDMVGKVAKIAPDPAPINGVMMACTAVIGRLHKQLQAAGIESDLGAVVRDAAAELLG